MLGSLNCTCAPYLFDTQAFDCLKTYAHRAGRAGRQGASGDVITFDGLEAADRTVLEAVLRVEHGVSGLSSWEVQWEGPRATWAACVCRGTQWRERLRSTAGGLQGRMPPAAVQSAVLL
jgi:superfamily II DNA/RNA helicase